MQKGQQIQWFHTYGPIKSDNNNKQSRYAFNAARIALDNTLTTKVYQAVSNEYHEPRRSTCRGRFIAPTADLSAYANPFTYPDEFLHHHYRPAGTQPYLLIFIRPTSHTARRVD